METKKLYKIKILNIISFENLESKLHKMQVVLKKTATVPRFFSSFFLLCTAHIHGKIISACRPPKFCLESELLLLQVALPAIVDLIGMLTPRVALLLLPENYIETHFRYRKCELINSICKTVYQSCYTSEMISMCNYICKHLILPVNTTHIFIIIDDGVGFSYYSPRVVKIVSILFENSVVI